jgi:hypothetical protein
MGPRILRGEAVVSVQSSVFSKSVVGRWRNLTLAPLLLGSFAVFCSSATSLQFLIPSERALSKVDLFTLREVVSQYTLDHQRSPRSFYELKVAGYLNSVPAFVDEHEVFVPVPEIQDPPLEVPLPNSSDPEKSHNTATRS